MTSLADAKRRLEDPRQAVRDAAAAELRAASAGDPGAAGVVEEATWKDRLAAIPPGVTGAQFEALTGATMEWGISSGQSTSARYRLDDHWTVTAYLDHADGLLKVDSPERRVHRVWVDPAAGF